MNRSVLLLTLLVLLTPWFGGCIGFYCYYPTHYAVYDAETGQPVAGASVHVQYMHNMMPMLNEPRNVGAITDESGRAILDVATHCPNRYPTVRTSAHGYIEYGVGSPREAGQHGTSLYPVNVYLYKEPLPKVTFVIPDGYRGPFMIDLRPVNTWIQDEPGKREFTFHLPPSGCIRINATPLLSDSRLRDMGFHLSGSSRFVYQNGTRIPDIGYQRYGPDDIAVRGLNVRTFPAPLSSTYQYLFVVGTANDAKEIAGNPNAFDALFDQSR